MESTRAAPPGEPSGTGLLDRISVVLVEPRGAGNVGSVARAMKNTGFSRLVLINPCDYDNDEGWSMACNAGDLLRSAEVYPDLDGFLTGRLVTVGTTRRVGKLRAPVLALAEAVPVMVEHAGRGELAVLFGREDRGLENDEIPRCDILVEIPTHEDYPSINLSHAVFTVCHHLFMAAAYAPPERGGLSGPAYEVASREDVAEMYEHLERVLKLLEYGDKGGEYLLGVIMRNFHRLFGRTALMEKEVNMLRGILAQVEKRVG